MVFQKPKKKYGLGVYVSVPHCLATGIENLATKAVIRPKSWGTLLGTTLWRYVQRYCARFLVCMLIQCSVYFVYACAGLLELNLLPHSWNNIRVQCEKNTEGCQ